MTFISCLYPVYLKFDGVKMLMIETNGGILGSSVTRECYNSFTTKLCRFFFGGSFGKLHFLSEIANNKML